MTNVEIAPSVAGLVRPEWMETVVARCQVFIGVVVMLDDPKDFRPLVLELTGAVANPQSPAEDLLLRGLVVEVAAKSGAYIHQRFHGPRTRQCGFVPASLLNRFWSGDRLTAKHAFVAWVEAFWIQFLLRHPPSHAQRAKRLVTSDIERSWELSELAREIGSTPSQLRRGFQREYGLTPGEYHRRVRLVHALEQLAENGGKIEPLSIEAGFRSKKNFYRAFAKMTGLTPTGFRAMNARQTRHIIDTARRSLHRTG